MRKENFVQLEVVHVSLVKKHNVGTTRQDLSGIDQYESNVRTTGRKSRTMWTTTMLSFLWLVEDSAAVS